MFFIGVDNIKYKTLRSVTEKKNRAADHSRVRRARKWEAMTLFFIHMNCEISPLNQSCE